MTRIRATCPSCGEIELRPEDIQLDIVRDRAGEVGDGSAYRFDCPTCLQQVEKPADERIARLLATGGVSIAINTLDEPLPGHPESPPEGPALTSDDLLDFHQLLETESWFGALEALVH